MEKILVTGGAGYVGSVLVPCLLAEGYQVRVLDNLMYGQGAVLLAHFSCPHFEFLRGDVREEETVYRAVKDVDAIVHLAAIVGYPACKKNPELARQVNVEGTRMLLRHRSPEQFLVFASTISNYGQIREEHCTEETPLNPLTVYGETKTRAEELCRKAGNTVCFRFATAFGLSPRLRLDLLINDFVYSALKRKNLIVYEKNYRRTFIHVRDMARAIMFALHQRQQMRDEVYNVGSENYTKEEIALMLRERLEFFLHFAEVGRDEDQRDYFASYEKIRRLGFETTITVEEGIEELIRGLEGIEVQNPYANV